MMLIGRRWFSSLSESFWAKPKDIILAMDIDKPTTQEATDLHSARIKRKLADDASLEAEKRRCGYLSRAVRPVRRMKLDSQEPSSPDQIPTALYQKPMKAEGKRICPSIFKAPVEKRSPTGDATPYWIPDHKLRVPLLPRRLLPIFPRAKLKRTRDEAFGHAPSKRLHKESDNQALYLHFRCRDWNYQPVPRSRFHRPRRNNSSQTENTRSENTCGPESPLSSGSIILYSGQSSGPKSAAEKPTSIPTLLKRRRQRPLALLKGTSKQVRFELGTLSIDGENSENLMEGLECDSTYSDTSNSSSSSSLSCSSGSFVFVPDGQDSPRALQSGPISFFLRQLENFKNRPLRFNVRHPYSVWGPLSI